MDRLEFNPFEKPLHLLDEAELQRLITNRVTEGWFIEFKRQVPVTGGNNLDGVKIAKTVAAFANTKGGWLFWGIDCQQNEASVLCGIDTTAFENLQDQLSRVISSHISPVPEYHLKEVQLAAGLCVLVIQVEPGVMPPYITSQGVIYQRENNESKPIRDRYILEKLNEKAQTYIDTVEAFSTFELGETKGQSEADLCFLEVYLFPRPFESFIFNDFYESTFFQKVADIFYESETYNFQYEDKEYPISWNMGFNSVFFTGTSIIIRPLKTDNLIYKHTTLELFYNGNLKFILPVNEFNVDNIPEGYRDSNVLEYVFRKYGFEGRYGTRDDFEDENEIVTGLPLLTERQRHSIDFPSNVKIVDGADIVFTILILLSKYKRVLEANQYDFKNPLGFRARISNAWRRFVFFESEDYLEKIKRYNIPLTPKNKIEIPAFEKGRSLRIDLNDDNSFLDLSRFILEGIGLPDSAGIDLWKIIVNSVKRRLAELDSKTN